MLRMLNITSKNRAILAPLAIFFTILLLGQIVSPGFASINNVTHILILAVPLGIMGIGETFVILSGTEDLDFSVGAHASLAVVLGAMFSEMGYPLYLTIIIILLIGTSYGIANGIGVRIAKVPPLIMTFGMAGIIYGTGLVFTRMGAKGEAPDLMQTLAIGRIGGFPISLFTWICLTILTFFLLKKTIYGRCLFAAGSNPTAASVAGVSTTTIGIITYALSGLFSAFAGLILLGRIVIPVGVKLAEDYTLPCIAAVVLGGTSFTGGEGGYIGTIGGALALTALTAFLPTLAFGEAGRIFMNGVVLLAILMFYARREKLQM